MAYSNLAIPAFVITNDTKVTGGDWTRGPVLFGQSCNALEVAAKAGARKSNTVAGMYDKTSSVFKNLIKSDKVFNGVAKGVNFIRKNINSFIVASSATKVLLAKKEDRKETLFSEAGCVGGMLLGEGWMKKHMDDKVLSHIAKLPIESKWLPVIKGALFVTGSITASTLGQKLTKYLFKKSEEYKATKQQALAHENYNSPKSIDLKS